METQGVEKNSPGGYVTLQNALYFYVAELIILVSSYCCGDCSF